MRSGLREVRYDRPFSKLTALNTISEAVPSRDPKEQGIGKVDMVGLAEVIVDLVGVDVDADDWGER